MKRALQWGISSVIALGACTPTLDDDAARADFPRVLAIRADPAEAAPGERVTLSALSTEGTNITWSLCVARKALAETGPIANECLAYPEERIPLGAGASASLTVPRDACRLFGPDPPLDGAGGRPADPDATGGYYQPGLATDAVFAVRLRCNLAGATQAQVADFETRYRKNTNPEITEIQINGTSVADEFQAHAGDRLHVRIVWPDTSAEHYIAFDPTTRSVVDRTESLRISWLASAGTFTHSRTDTPENDFTVVGPTALYFVVRDDRGGTAFRTVKLTQ